MIKYPFFVLCLLVVTTSCVYSQNYIGVYKTNPELFLGFKEPYSQRQNKIIDHMSWTITITQDRIIYSVKKDIGKIEMSYTVDGRFILGKGSSKNRWKYTPYYFEEPDKLYGLGTVFFKENESSD